MNKDIRYRCNLAFQKKVARIYSNAEVQKVTEYLIEKMGKNNKALRNIMKFINKDHENKVMYVTTRKDTHIVFLLKDGSNIPIYPDPLTKDVFKMGYPSSFCFCYNIGSPMDSNFGFVNFEYREDGYYHMI